jgi:hypothetical protein
MRRRVLAMLVHWVYFRDLDPLGTWAARALGYGNRRAESYGKEHWEHMDCTPFRTGKAELTRLGLAFLIRKDPHPYNGAPRLAIVLRGTIPYKVADLLLDLKVGAALLEEDERFRRCGDLIRAVIQDFRNRNGGPNEICIAGHSLGAAIALKVGIDLKLRGTSIETHLFNPVMLTYVSILTGQFLPGESTSIINTEDDADGVHRRNSSGFGASLRTRLLKVVLPKALSKEWNEFERLHDWSPHFYLNPRDLVCLQYLKFYRRRRHRDATPLNVVDPQGVMTRLFGEDGKYLRNVVPSANLYISHKFEGNLVLAHSLKQWHKYTDTDIKLESEPVRLLAGGRP